MPRITISSLLLTLLLASPVLAQESVVRAQPKPGLTLGAGKLKLDVNVENELSSDKVAKPLSIAPDVWYGVTPDLTLGLIHSRFATTGFRGAAGGGLCLSGEADGCAHVYDNVGLEGWYSVARGPLALAAGGGALAVSLDKGYYSAKLGLKARWAAGKLAVNVMPAVIVAVTEREDAAGNRLNKDTLWVPVSAMYKATPALSVGAGTGIKGPIDTFADSWMVSLGFLAGYTVSPQLSLGASLVFGAFFSGAENPAAPLPPVEGADLRVLQVWASYTM